MYIEEKVRVLFINFLQTHKGTGGGEEGAESDHRNEAALVANRDAPVSFRTVHVDNNCITEPPFFALL